MAIAIALSVILFSSQCSAPWRAQAIASAPSYALPALQSHPLPSTLAPGATHPDPGDYFSDIQPTPAGYLIWSQLPVSVYVEPVSDSENFQAQRAQVWYDAVVHAVMEWTVYLPLVLIEEAEQADIRIWRRSPPLMVNGQLVRARTAEARYEFYLKAQAERPILAHRFTIWLRPDQTDRYTQASARHELGHALGIWGHSPVETDALYFSQVRSPSNISPRDVNTLRRIYEQPTRLGWPVLESGE